MAEHAGDWPQNVFDPPAFLDDLDDVGKASWSNKIADMVEYSKVERDGEFGAATRPQWFNPLEVSTRPTDLETNKKVTWTAFPNWLTVTTGSNEERWKRADASRDVQNGYCEWAVTRNAEGKITRMDFTTEGPEYWEHIAETDKEELLSLYRELIGPEVRSGCCIELATFTPAPWSRSIA